jgi:probable phosphoglycerate mutase
VDVVAIRHDETPWSLSGQHTSRTDIPLTDNGRRLAERLRPVFAGRSFALVLVSPMQRARETCGRAGFGAAAVVDPDLCEWDYGKYEGMTTEQIHKQAPGWQLFRDGCPGGEQPAQVGLRADRVIRRARAAGGWRLAGSDCRRVRGNISCSIPGRSASSAITATARPSRSGTDRFRSRREG